MKFVYNSGSDSYALRFSEREVLLSEEEADEFLSSWKGQK